MSKYDESALYIQIGNRIRLLRNERKLTQQYLADELQLPRTSITNIEGGGQRITIHLLFEISRVLGITPQELIPSLHEIEHKVAEDLPPVTANFVNEFMKVNES